MIKKIILLAVLIVGVAAWFWLEKSHKILPSSEKNLNRDQKESPRNGEIVYQNTIFVPYWSLDDQLDLTGYDRVIYFGVAAGVNGVDKEDQGYENLRNFSDLVPNKTKKFLAVRMTNSETNFSVLENKNSQEKIIRDSIDTAHEFGFEGVVLDLELFSIFNDNIPSQISHFVESFSTNLKDENLSFAVTVYGDNFYRKRPYDVKFISSKSDEILIMTYDLHKPQGEPGPNFPLFGREKYGYDLQTMIKDFESQVDPKKITVIFGMYGYDWTVDEYQRPFKPATSLTFNQIKEKYLDSCTFKNCQLLRDDKSKEEEIEYVDQDARSHIIWFEDEKSVDQKKDFLREKGIGSVAFWAYGYF